MEATADKDSVRVGFEIAREELLERMAGLALDRMFSKHYPDSIEEGPGYDYVDLGELKGLVEKKVARAVDAQIKDLVATVTAERVGAELEKILTDGWQKTDEYGRPSGAKFTLRDHALSLLTKTDRYNQTSYMDEQARAQVQKALTETLKPEIDALKQKAKNALNSGFEQAIRTALASGAGLKT